MDASLVERRKVLALERIADLLAELARRRPAAPSGIEWLRKEDVCPQCGWAGTPHCWICPYASARQIGLSANRCCSAGSASVPVPPQAGYGISLTGNETTTTKGEQ